MKSWPCLKATVAIVGLLFVSHIQAAEISVTISDAETGAFIDRVEVDCYLESSTDGYGGKWIIGEPGHNRVYWQSSDPEGGSVELYGALDPDPMISFGGGVVDFGAPSNFSFQFILPLSPQVNNPSTVFDSLTGTVTNGGAAGVTVTALGPPGGIPVDIAVDGITEMQVFTLSDDNQANWKNVGLDQGPTQAFPGLIGSATYGPLGGFNQGPIATIPVAGVGAWTDMRADINFRLSGGNDAFSFSGAKVLVPEPGTILLALCAIAAGGFCRRRR